MPNPPDDGARGTDESLEDVSVEQNPTQDVVTFFGLAAAPFLVGPTFENASSVGRSENDSKRCSRLCVTEPLSRS